MNLLRSKDSQPIQPSISINNQAPPGPFRFTYLAPPGGVISEVIPPGGIEYFCSVVPPSGDTPLRFGDVVPPSGDSPFSQNGLNSFNGDMTPPVGSYPLSYKKELLFAHDSYPIGPNLN